MLQAKSIIHINDFDFENGQPIKGRYFIVLDDDLNTSLVLSVVTSQDHIPVALMKHGCVHAPDLNIHCHHLSSKKEIGENGFKFSKDSFIYISGATVFEQDFRVLTNLYPETEIQLKDKLIQKEYENLVYCVYKSNRISKKIKLRMTAILERIV